MGDLFRTNDPTAVQIMGSTASGGVLTPVMSDGNGGLIIAGEGTAGSLGGGVLTVQGTGPTGVQLPTRDVINVSSQYRAQSVTTTAAEALGGATILSNRKVITITPTNGTIYWGTNSSVTTTTGTPLFANQMLTLAFTDNVHVYVIAAATTDARIMEGS